MNRITRKNLEALCSRINDALGAKQATYETVNGHSVANVGTFYVSGAYGGYCFNRIVNESGGVTCPIVSGHVTARECWDAGHAFLAGITAGRANT